MGTLTGIAQDRSSVDGMAGPVQRMLDDTASSLGQPATYIDAVLTQASAHRGSP